MLPNIYTLKFSLLFPIFITLPDEKGNFMFLFEGFSIFLPRRIPGNKRIYPQNPFCLTARSIADLFLETSF